MFKRQTNEILYFSTTVDLKINKVVYRPSICYKVPPFTKASLERYEAEGKVTFYKNPVRFVNGVVVATAIESSSVGVPSIVRTDEVKAVKKKSK